MTTAANTPTVIRTVPIERIIEDTRLAGLFLSEPQTIGRIRRSMATKGYDAARPIDVWPVGRNLVCVEGHQRLAAAKAAGLTEVRVAYRHFEDFNEALLWAAEQQANRRNASKEAQCLSILRALELAGETDTTANLAERFGFSTATIDRARQVLKRGTEAEVIAVMEGQHGLRRAYDLIRAREKAEAAPLPADEERQPPVEPDEDDDGDLPEPEPDNEVTRYVLEMQDALQTLTEAVDQARDLWESDVAQIMGSTSDWRSAVVADIYDATITVDELGAREPDALRKTG